jgi:hypothetical protein
MSSTASLRAKALISVPQPWCRLGVYSTLFPVPNKTVQDINERAKKNYILAYTCVGEYFKIGKAEFPAKPEDLQFAESFWELARKLLGHSLVSVRKLSMKTRRVSRKY